MTEGIKLVELDSKNAKDKKTSVAGRIEKLKKKQKIVAYMSFDEKCEYYGYDKKNIISSIVLNTPDSPDMVKRKSRRIISPAEIRVSKNHRMAA